MNEGAEIVTLYAPEPAPRVRRKKPQRVGWPAAALGAFVWAGRVGIVLLAGMQIRALLF